MAVERKSKVISMSRHVLIVTLCGFVLTAANAVVAEDSFTQRKNVVYGEVHGVALVMDISTC